MIPMAISTLEMDVRLVILLLRAWSQQLKKAREILMIFNMLKFHFNFIAKNECLEHFIAEWNQCFSRISLYRLISEF